MCLCERVYTVHVLGRGGGHRFTGREEAFKLKQLSTIFHLSLHNLLIGFQCSFKIFLSER